MKRNLEWIQNSQGWTAREHRFAGLNEVMYRRFADVYMPGVWYRPDGYIDKQLVRTYTVDFCAVNHPIREFETEQEALVYVESIFALESL